MNITEAQVPQVEKHGDTFVIPPTLVCSRYYELAMTVLYDCYLLGANCDDLDELAESFKIHPHHRHPLDIQQWIQKHGRVVVDKWFGPVTHKSHVEPVEKTP